MATHLRVCAEQLYLIHELYNKKAFFLQIIQCAILKPTYIYILELSKDGKRPPSMVHSAPMPVLLQYQINEDDSAKNTVNSTQVFLDYLKHLCADRALACFAFLQAEPCYIVFILCFHQNSLLSVISNIDCKFMPKECKSTWPACL